MKNSQNHDFEAHQHPEEGSPTISKLWFMDIIPLATLKTNMSPCNPILAPPGPQKNVKNAKMPIKKGRKVDFLILGHGGLGDPRS